MKKKIQKFWYSLKWVNQLLFKPRLILAKKKAAKLHKKHDSMTYYVLPLFGRPIIASKNMIIQRLNDTRKYNNYRKKKMRIHEIEKGALFVIKKTA